MFGIGAVIFFAIALLLQLASLSKGVFFTVTTFMLLGLLSLALHLVAPVNWSIRRN